MVDVQKAGSSVPDYGRFRYRNLRSRLELDFGYRLLMPNSDPEGSVLEGAVDTSVVHIVGLVFNQHCPEAVARQFAKPPKPTSPVGERGLLDWVPGFADSHHDEWIQSTKPGTPRSLSVGSKSA